MFLYLLTRTDTANYDEYISAVVCAKSKKEARYIHPRAEWDNEETILNWNGIKTLDWTSANKVKVTYLGKAKTRLRKGIIDTNQNWS